MKPTERKQKLVQDLINLRQQIGVERLIGFPRQQDTQEWLAEVAAIFKNLDEGDYQEIVRLSKTINPTENRLNRTKAAHEIYNFVTRKIAEYKRYDFNAEKNPLPSSKTFPELMMGEGGRNGQPGGGGSIFIQAENFTMNGSGRISADGGDVVVHQNELNNFGTINQTTVDTINTITKLTHTVSQSGLSEEEKRQLIGDIETIKAQLIKPTPDKTILQKAWEAIQVASTIGGAAQLLGLIGPVVLAHLK